MENSPINDTRKDLSNLLDCLKLHEDDKEISEIQEVLKTVVLVCCTNTEAKDIFRELNGLPLVFDFMCKTKSILIMEACLNTLANVMDINVHNQKIMSKKEVFQVIRGILSDRKMPQSLMKKTLFFISVLLFQNNTAQILIQQTGCLQDLIDMYEQCFPFVLLDKVLSYHLDISEAKQPSSELWLHVNRTLCFAVNNPLNGKNQTMCSALFPVALRILQASSNCEIIGAVSTFLTVSMESNVYNKDLFAEYDGPVVLKFCFLKGLDYIFLDIEKYKDIVNKGYAEAIFSIVEVLDIALSDHSQNSEVMGKLGFICWLVKLLKIDVVNEEWKVKIVLTIGHSIDAYGKNTVHLLKENDLPNLLRVLMLNGNKDLLSACQYLIEVCIKNGGPFEKQSIMEKLSVSEPHDEDDIMDIKPSDETIDLSSSATLVQDNENVHLPQKECATEVMCQSNDVPFVKNENFQITQEQSYFHVDSVTTVHNDCNDKNNSHHPGKSTEFPSQQSFTKPTTQTHGDDDDILVLDEPEKHRNLCCDYCSCESHVISMYSCGCTVLHGCHCQNINCMVSCHMFCPALARTAYSNDCAKYGCGKLCKNDLLCRNSHRSHRKTLFDKVREEGKANHVVRVEAAKPDGTGGYGSRSNKSSSSSKSIAEFFPKISICKKDANEAQSVHSFHRTSEAPLKENRSVNLEVDVKPKANASVLFKKPREMPVTKSKQTVLQNSGPLFKSTTVISRHRSSPSSVTAKAHSEVSLQHSLERGKSPRRTLVSFSPFRKSDLPECSLPYKMDDSRSIGETSGSEKLSFFDIKLLRASSHTSAFQTHPLKRELQKKTALKQVKIQQNNENRPTLETTSKYFASSKESLKQNAPSIKDQLCAKFLSTNNKQSLHQKKKFLPSGSCDDGTPPQHQKKENIAAYFQGKSGLETNEKDVSNDTDVQVISVFGSTCSKHNLSNSSEVVHVITLES